MKILSTVMLILITACSHSTQKSFELDKNLAYDDMALGNISATALKIDQQDAVCFEIKLIMKNIAEKEAHASNWTFAWVDRNSRYHLMSLNQRDPASSPVGTKEKWTNHLKTCVPKDRQHEFMYLILTPKELSYKETEGMRFEWK
jgi:hypothetical protein